MAIETIDHATFATLSGTGEVRSVHIVGQAGGWRIQVKFATSERVLASQRTGQVRVFHDFDTLVACLKEIGISCFDVDAVNYEPDTVGTLPDQAAAVTDAHEAAAYTKWLMAEIQEAIDDPSPMVPHDEAMRQIRAAIKRG